MKKYEELTKREKITGFVTLAMVVLIAWVILTPSDKQPMQEPTEPTQTSTPAPTVEPTVAPEYDEEVINAVYRGAFVSSCSESGEVSEAKCRCMFDYMIDTYGIEKIVEVASDEQLSQTYSLEAALECINIK